jgi:hypothetical protein
LVEVQVGDDVFFRDSEVLGEVRGAEQAFFFAGEDAEEERASGSAIPIVKFISECDPAKLVREFDEEGDIGCVVERAVVEIVAEDGGAVAIAVEVCGERDVLGGEFGVSAGEDGEDVGGGDVFAG